MRSLLLALAILVLVGEFAWAGDSFVPMRRFGPADPPRLIPAADDPYSHELALISHRRGFYGPGWRYPNIYTPWYRFPNRWWFYSSRPWFGLYSPGFRGPIPFGRFFPPATFPYGRFNTWGFNPGWGYSGGYFHYGATNWGPEGCFDTASAECYYW